jgi:uncharacterized protein (TIGR02594 family)
MNKLEVIAPTTLWSQPSTASESMNDLWPGEILFPTGEQSPDPLWAKVEATNGETTVSGWVLLADCKDVSNAQRPDLDMAGFIGTCVVAERTINKLPATAPWFVSADFVIARGIIETGLKNAAQKLVGSDGVGPLQVSSAEWGQFLKAAGAGFDKFDYDKPSAQTYGAAYRMYADAKAISEAMAVAGTGSAKDPFLPSYLDVFHAYITNSVPAAVAIIAAQSANPGGSIKDLLKDKLTDAQLSAFFKNRQQFADTIDHPKSVRDFVSATEKALNDALKQAFDLIKQHAPESIPQIVQGSAPWFQVAKGEEAKGVSEASSKQTILDYFKATDIKPLPTTILAWCGAFVSHCIANCGNKDAAKSVPAGSALAVNWRSWGVPLPIQSSNIAAGAVVVLSPSPGTNTSGHVGFFVEFVDGGQKVRLLGGNQSDKVQQSDYPVSRIVAVRWLNLFPSASSGKFNLSSLLSKAQPIAQLIVDTFAAAGFGVLQQAAALANAKAESNFDPNARSVTSKEDSVGLFQLNRLVEPGSHYSVEQLQDPNINISAIIAKIGRGAIYESFVHATSLEEAVTIFVKHVEVPANIDAQIQKRLDIAQSLLATA